MTIDTDIDAAIAPTRLPFIHEGSPRAHVWIVGEAPGEDEVRSRRPFMGASGSELNRMLSEAGLSRSDCFLTNVCHEQPPPFVRAGKTVHNYIEQWFATKTAAAKEGLACVADRYPRPPVLAGLCALHHWLDTNHPHIIIALGNTALWALHGVTGISKWRGSVIATRWGKVLPTFHPADVLRSWTHRPVVVQDLRRARQESDFPHVREHEWHFTVPRHLADIRQWFGDCAADATRPLISDTEGWGRVDCIGFAADRHSALCIPFTHPGADEDASPHYWPFDDELAITEYVCNILRERPVVFHNALWDCQVIARRWGLVPRLHGDTQAMQHVCFPGLLGGRIDPVTGAVDKKGSSLSLSFCASMYADNYCYWKDDGRTFDPAIHDEAQLWRYNCMDCVYTYEVFDVLSGLLDTYNLHEQYAVTMQLFAPVLRAMFRGIRYDRAEAVRQRRWFGQVDRSTGIRTGALGEVAEWLDEAVGCDFNPESSTQMRALFYDDLQLPRIKHRKTGAPTLDDAALDTIGRRTPLLRPLVRQIQHYRTLDTLRAAVDPQAASPSDGRLRFALNIAFVETMRFSCNESAFGEGGNLQNIKRPDND